MSGRSPASRGSLALVLWLSLLGQACSTASIAKQAKDRSVPDALFAHGTALLARGDHVRAEQYIQLAIARGYPRRRAVVPLLKACLGSSRLRAALAHIESFLASHPDEFRLRLLGATIHGALGRDDRERAELERLIAEHPSYPEAHFALGVLLQDQRSRWQSARIHLATYLRLSPFGRHAHEAERRLALAHSQVGKAAIEP